MKKKMLSKKAESEYFSSFCYKFKNFTGVNEAIYFYFVLLYSEIIEKYVPGVTDQKQVKLNSTISNVTACLENLLP